jgi:CelD/BcsL family acetyltransferase involved in cellulose biosynthesis
MLCIYLLRLDAVPIAHAYGLVYKNRLNVLTTAYRETYSRLSPGAVLFGRLLEDTFASGLREVDLLGEAYRWKQELTSTTRPHVSVEVYPKSLWSLGMRAYASSWKPWLKRHLPWLAKLKRGLLRSRQDCQ